MIHLAHQVSLSDFRIMTGFMEASPHWMQIELIGMPVRRRKAQKANERGNICAHIYDVKLILRKEIKRNSADNQASRSCCNRFVR